MQFNNFCCINHLSFYICKVKKYITTINTDMIKIYSLLTIMFLSIGMGVAQPSNTHRNDDIKKDSTTVEKMKYNSWDAALFLGMQNYYGDLANTNFFPGGMMSGKFNWDAGLKVKYNYSRYFGFQGNFSYGRMAAQMKSSNAYFTGSTIDFDLGLFINMTTLLNPKKYNKRWYWDVNVNFGGVKYDADSYDGSDNLLANSSDLTTNLGIGTELSYRITDKLNLGLDFRVNSVGHDLLDAVEKGKSNDAYGHLSLILGYTFGKEEESYKWNPMEDDLKELWEAVNKNSDDIDSLDNRVSKLEAYHGKGAEELPDDDNDGVPNEFDQSPNTPEGTMVNFLGIPIPLQDTTKQVGSGTSAPGSILGSVFFDYNRSNVSRADYKKLAAVAQYLNSHSDAKVSIVGHTDSKGSDEYNEKLSKKRSDAVVKILTEGFGINASRLKVVAEGKKTSLSQKYDDVNRRVDIVVE
jgi:OOP family OmpA-OmpF porin